MVLYSLRQNFSLGSLQFLAYFDICLHCQYPTDYQFCYGQLLRLVSACRQYFFEEIGSLSHSQVLAIDVVMLLMIGQLLLDNDKAEFRDWDP